MENERTTRAGSKRRVNTGGTNASWQPQGETEDKGAVEQAKARVGQLADQAQQQVTEKARSGVAQGKARAAETLSSIASSLLLSSQQLRDQNQGGVSRYVERAADQLDSVARYLQTAEPSELVDRVENFARRQPALFIGGAFALGLLGARFLKSSRRDRLPEDWRQAGDGLPARISYPADREIVEAPVDPFSVPTTPPYTTGYDPRGL
jgi:hypothetical protein